MLGRLCITPFASVFVWLGLTTAFSLDDGARTLLTIITEPAATPSFKLIVACFTLLVILGSSGLVLTFLVTRPVIFVLVGGVAAWLCSLVMAGYEHSSAAIQTWEIAYFWLSLMITASALLLFDDAPRAAAKAATG